MKKRFLFLFLPCILVACATTGTGGANPTLTPIPGVTVIGPTPTVASETAPCSPADLSTGSHSNGAAGSIFLGVWFTNTGSAPCYLQAWPQVTLVDSSGNPLDVQYVFWDMASTTPQAGATEQAASATTARVGLNPGQTAGFNMLWRNWCSPALTGPAVVRVALGQGVANLTTDLTSGGRCDTASAGSTVSVAALGLVSP